nr:hypothetical protein [Allomuricauda sp.]
MTKLFLKSKHWQLFTILVGIPFLLQFYVYRKIFWYNPPPVEPNPDSKGFTEVLNEEFIQFDFPPFLTIVFFLLFFGWFWSIAIGLQKKIPQRIKMKVTKFKVFFFIPFTYIILLMIYLGGLFSGMGTDSFLISGWIFAIIVPFHLLSMFGIFYSLYFAAKTIKTAELQREVGFGDFVAEFFLLWFYFIGIWIIQPKVNKLYSK